MKIQRVTVGELGTNCYIVSCGNEGAIIDPGAEAESILQAAGSLHITHIILTHGHFDHILALPKLMAAYPQAKLCVAEKEAALLADPACNLTELVGLAFQAPRADWLLREGDLIPLGEQCWKVLETPGHTVGSICLLWEDVLISGDTLFCGGMGRCDLPTGNLQEEVASILHKLFLLPEQTKVYPGHGQDTTIGAEKKTNEVYHWQ